MGFHEEQEKALNIKKLAKTSAKLIGRRDRAVVEGIEAGLDMDTASWALKEEAERLGDSMFRTLFMGTFKNGKSTTINAILGSEMLPAKATAATAVISQVVYGNDSNHVKIFRTGKKEPEILSLREFFAKYQLTEEDERIIENTGELDRFSDIEYVEMQSDLALFKDGLQFIDSPGLEEASARTKTTDNFVPKANAIIFLLDATHLFSEKEKLYVKMHFEYAEPRPRNVFFLINRINQLTEDPENVKKSAFAHLKPVFTDDDGYFDKALMEKRVFFVNAYQALQDRKAGRIPYNTGMVEFQDALEEFLTSNDRIVARYQPLLSNMAADCIEVQKANQHYEQAMKIPYKELCDNYNTAEKELKELEKDLEKMRNVIMKTSDNVKLKIVSSLRQFVSTDMPTAWPDALAACDKKFGLIEMVKVAVTRDEKKRTEILKPLVDFVNDFVEDQLRQWGKTVAILIQDDLEDLKKETESQTQEFDIKLDKIVEKFTGIKAKPGAGGEANKLQLALSLIQGDFSVAVDNAAGGNFDWGEFAKKYMIQAVINIVIASMFTGGAAIFVALLVEAIQIQVNAGKRRDKILNGLAESVFPRIRETVEEQIPSIRETIDKEFREQGDRICAVGLSLVADKKKEMQSLLEQRKRSESESKEEMERRNTIYEKLFRNTAEVYRLVYNQTLTKEHLDKAATMTRKAETSKEKR
ncbi:MAG: dynamin family protein [Eubacteriales bacterium]|nr:dynamin family protein [Eubacteriales bacterium]